MPNRCEYVDPLYNVPCGKLTTLAKIVINLPLYIQPVVRFVCKIHGDIRFDYLAQSEINLKKLKDNNKIQYDKYKKSLRNIRWSRCRMCNADFVITDVVCCLEYYWLTKTRVSMRRSFLLHDFCLKSEMGFFNVQKSEKFKNQTLDDSIVETHKVIPVEVL